MSSGNLCGGVKEMGFGNMQKLMQQAKKMQEDMARKQEELKEKVIEVSSGGGAVSVAISLDMTLRSVRIKKDVVDPEDVELLEDLVLAAVREALEKAKDQSGKEMAAITGGLSIPGM